MAPNSVRDLPAVAAAYVRRLALALVVALASALWATATKGACTLVRVDEWPVRWVRGQIVVAGAVNGRAVGILVDTGAQRSLVLRAAADRLGLRRQAASGLPFFGIGGATTLEVTEIADFRIGTARRSGWQLPVAGEHDLGPDLDLILGEDFFRAFDVEFDLGAAAIRLFHARDCADRSLAYWTRDDPAVVALEPISELQPQIAFTIHLNDRPIDAILDSGATTSIVATADAAAAGVRPESPGSIPAGPIRGLGLQTVDSWIGVFRSVAVGNETIRDVRLRVADLYRGQKFQATGSRLMQRAAPTQPMLLGVDFLRAHRVFVAHSQRRLYLTPTGGPVFSDGAAPPAPTGPPALPAWPGPSDAHGATGVLERHSSAW